MASILITKFFKSIQPPKNSPLPVQTKGQDLPENQADEAVNRTGQPQTGEPPASTTQVPSNGERKQKRKRKANLKRGSKRSKVVDSPTDSPTMLSECNERNRELSTGGVGGEGCDQPESEMDNRVTTSLYEDCHMTNPSPLKHSPAIILGEHVQSTISPRRDDSPGKIKQRVSVRRTLTLPVRSNQSHPEIVHARQCDPGDSFQKLTSSHLHQLSSTCPHPSSPSMSGYGTLTASRNRMKSTHAYHHLPVSD